MCSRMTRLAARVADAVLDDAAHAAGSTVRNSLSTGAVAIFGWISSVMRSSFQPSASAIIETDSVRPTWRTLPVVDLLLRTARA